MATQRVNITSASAPTTNFITEADMVSQTPSGNYSTVYFYVQAINRGSTASNSGYPGGQSATIGGYGGVGHSGTMPSGVATGAQRWYDGPFGVNLPHDAAGNRGADSVVQSIRGWYGTSSASAAAFARDDYGTIGPYPRIPKAPSKPGTPVASHVLPTSLQLDWTASTDNGGAAIDAYLVRRWTGPTMTGTYVDISSTNTITRVDTGLTPGTQYTYGIYAHNGSYAGYSVVSTGLTVKTIAPMRMKVGGVYKYAVPYQKIGGHYTMMQPFVKVGGVYKQTG